MSNEQQGADAVFGGDGATRQDAQSGRGCERSNGDEADIGLSGGEMVGAFRGQHPMDVIALGEGSLQRRMLEVPHQGRRIQKANGGDAERLES